MACSEQEQQQPIHFEDNDVSGSYEEVSEYEVDNDGAFSPFDANCSPVPRRQSNQRGPNNQNIGVVVTAQTLLSKQDFITIFKQKH